MTAWDFLSSLGNARCHHQESWIHAGGREAFQMFRMGCFKLTGDTQSIR